MFASDSAVVRTSCATWPQAGLRATHARPRTKRPLQLTRGPPPASVGVGAPLRLPRATPVRKWSPCVAELCRARHARSQNPGTKGRTSDNGRRRSRPAILTPSGLAHCHATPADGPSLTVIFDAYLNPARPIPASGSSNSRRAACRSPNPGHRGLPISTAAIVSRNRWFDGIHGDGRHREPRLPRQDASHDGLFRKSHGSIGIHRNAKAGHDQVNLASLRLPTKRLYSCGDAVRRSS